jgi:NAD(P)-dependent dehydrogenase (short-subunit alcohol dehydrogenase family)
MNGCQVTLAGFLEQGKPGAIYNILGAGADGKPVARMIGYATTKAAVTFLTRSLAAEVAGGDVVVGGLSPGLVMTEGFLREHAQTPPADRARREAVVNIIGDHPETIGRWAAKIVDHNRVQGRIFTWLTPAKIRRRAAETGRDVLSGYLA